MGEWQVHSGGAWVPAALKLRHGGVWVNGDGSSPAGQAPVSLAPIDGEYITSSGAQSNFVGLDSFTRRGFTNAMNWSGPRPDGGTYDGWGDPTFLRTAAWLFDSDDPLIYDRMNDLGMNGMLPAAHSIDLTANVTEGKWAFVTAADYPGGTITSAEDPNVLGFTSNEEPDTDTLFNTYLSELEAYRATADGPGRMSLYNFTAHLLNGELNGGVTTPAQMALSGDFVSCDQYWYAGAFAGGQSLQKLHFYLYRQDGDATIDQAMRGSNYGSMADAIRKHFPSGQRRPFGIWVEAGAPFTEVASRMITPAQMKWAIWSTIVHGICGIYIFNHTFRTGDPLTTVNVLADNAYGGPGIPGTGIYAAVKEVNLRALELATVINSPFDGYFVYGDLEYGQPVNTGRIETPGFLTGVVSANGLGPYSGVDASCKWHEAEGVHYIFATTRESGSETNIPVEFQMEDQGQTSAVPVFGGSPITVQRVGGICMFEDTFALASDYKVYRIV